MPGDLTTTSHPMSEARPPSTSARSSATTTGSTASVRSLSTFAWPSMPRPHTPTLRPRRSAHESGGRIVVWGEMRADRTQQLRDVRDDALALWLEFTGEIVQQ